MIEELVLAWTRGWSVSRGTPAPVPSDGAYRIDVGRPGHHVRYVLPHPHAKVIRRLTDQENAPGTWLKICAEPARIAPLLPSGWSLQQAPEYLMSAPLSQDAPPPSSGGYTLRLTTTGRIVKAAVQAPDGTLAATGQAGLADTHAVFDQIATEPAHRRRGLGAAVMSALSSAAAAQGAGTGVLVATTEGRALYRHLGWQEASPMTAAHLP
ncbi:GNAT family N-acetyltransferase [Actinomadura gamaensis]|uniref:GNAT family N-acetyltransferase n=1 Tax=Actinomadura gamaensis TaxID=1763541 RepID=A0ABV9UDC9_9ACTN